MQVQLHAAATNACAIRCCGAQERKLQFLQGNFRVICRVRPVLEAERSTGRGLCVADVTSEDEVVITRELEARSQYGYDRVFPESSSQEEIFEYVHPLCEIILDGYSVCILSYGQSGSGKTYTMEGDFSDESNWGIVPRVIAMLFETIHRRQQQQLQLHQTYTLAVSMLEIYNETVFDLLVSDATAKVKLDVRHMPEGVKVPGLTEVQVLLTLLHRAANTQNYPLILLFLSQLF